MDFIAILPLQIINMKRNRHYLFLLLKCIRLKKGLKMIKASFIMKQVKQQYAKRLQKMIDDEEPEADSTLGDYTKIRQILLINYAIKTFRLVVLILSTSYFLGMFWYVLCDFQDDFILDDNFHDYLHDE